MDVEVPVIVAALILARMCWAAVDEVGGREQRIAAGNDDDQTPPEGRDRMPESVDHQQRRQALQSGSPERDSAG
jgi:hypothetical protein